MKLTTQQARARATIQLLELDIIDTRDDVVDLRWKFRYEAYLKAASMYKVYSEMKINPVWTLLVQLI